MTGVASRAPSSPLAVIHLDSLARTGPRVRQASRRERRGRAGPARAEGKDEARGHRSSRACFRGHSRGPRCDSFASQGASLRSRTRPEELKSSHALPGGPDRKRGAAPPVGRASVAFLRVASGRRLPSRRRHLRLRGTFPTASRWAVTSLVTAEDPEPQRPRVQQQGLGFGTENSWFSLSPHCVTRLGRLRAHAA